MRRGSLAAKITTAALLILAFAAAGVIYLVRPRTALSDDAPPPRLLEVKTARLALQTLPNTVEVSGFLEPHRSVRLAMEESGTVEEKPFEEGASVSSEAVLVQLDSELAEAEVAQAEALLTEANRALDLAQQRAERARALARDHAVSEDELQSKETAFTVANAVLARQRAAHDLAAAHLRRHRLVAPMGGVLSELDVEVGSMVTTGQVIGRLDDVSLLDIDLLVAPEVREALHLGDAVDLWRDTDPLHVRTGVITRLADVADDLSRKFEVEVRVDNTDRSLLAGAPVRCRLTLGTPRRALLLPEEWTTSHSVLRGAYRVVDDGDSTAHVEFAPIEPRRLHEAPGFLEVLSGLAPGDVVATERLTELSDGLEIIPQPAEARSLGGS
jgi:membrane fusion protein (multidrug efflux system)